MPLEAEIAALPSVNQRQKTLVERVDEAAREYISGPLRELLSKEIAEVEKATEQSGHFSVDFGFDPYRNRALDILVVSYKSVFHAGDDYVQAFRSHRGWGTPRSGPSRTA